MTGFAPSLRLSMSGRAPTREAESARYRAAVEIAEYADRHGFATVNVEEHHDAEAGWLPSPLVLAALIAARTEQVTIRAGALLAPLYDPIRLAEDVAVLDLASQGRFVLVIGQGYRQSEYHVMDRDFSQRGPDTDFLVETLFKAWTGEPFDYRGRTVHVSPRPLTAPHPPLVYGGRSLPAARRAARYGLPFMPSPPAPEYEQTYRAECARLGHTPQFIRTPSERLLIVDPDPEAAWRELGPYLLTEARQYASWRVEGMKRELETQGQRIEDVRASGLYEILSPDECLERGRRRLAETGAYQPILHPLAGGIPPERAWRCMKLFVEEVAERL